MPDKPDDTASRGALDVEDVAGRWYMASTPYTSANPVADASLIPKGEPARTGQAAYRAGAAALAYYFPAWRHLWILAVAALSAPATPKLGKGQVISYNADLTDRLAAAIDRAGCTQGLVQR